MRRREQLTDVVEDIVHVHGAVPSPLSEPVGESRIASGDNGDIAWRPRLVDAGRNRLDRSDAVVAAHDQDGRSRHTPAKSCPQRAALR
jgi:hypothetical protein